MALSSMSSPKALSFRHIMSIRPTSTNTFVSVNLSHWPPGGNNRAFGGQVYAQAAYAASKTVPLGMVVHNVTGHFLQLGRSDLPFEYRVRRIRDGGIYCWRSVDVYQSIPASKENTPCFILTISFKRDEGVSIKRVPFEYQTSPKDHLQQTYRSVLEGKQPADHPVSPGADNIWWQNTAEDNVAWGRTADQFPGVEIRKVDMTAYNAAETWKSETDKRREWRQLCFYRMRVDDAQENQSDVRAVCNAVAEGQDDGGDDLNLDACAHMYASDRNSLFLLQRALGFYEREANMASLSHTVVLHGSPRGLRMRDKNGQGKWFVQEAWMGNSAANRGCHESRLWDWEEGRIVASTLQDGMIRIAESLETRIGSGKL